MFEAHTINAEHKDLIHDIAYDFYGERMATCSSDHFVKVNKQLFQLKLFCNLCLLKKKSTSISLPYYLRVKKLTVVSIS